MLARRPHRDPRQLAEGEPRDGATVAASGHARQIGVVHHDDVATGRNAHIELHGLGPLGLAPARTTRSCSPAATPRRVLRDAPRAPPLCSPRRRSRRTVRSRRELLRRSTARSPAPCPPLLPAARWRRRPGARRRRSARRSRRCCAGAARATRGCSRSQILHLLFERLSDHRVRALRVERVGDELRRRPR